MNTVTYDTKSGRGTASGNTSHCKNIVWMVLLDVHIKGTASNVLSKEIRISLGYV